MTPRLGLSARHRADSGALLSDGARQSDPCSKVSVQSSLPPGSPQKALNLNMVVAASSPSMRLGWPWMPPLRTVQWPSEGCLGVATYYSARRLPVASAEHYLYLSFNATDALASRYLWLFDAVVLQRQLVYWSCCFAVRH